MEIQTCAILAHTSSQWDSCHSLHVNKMESSCSAGDDAQASIVENVVDTLTDAVDTLADAVSQRLVERHFILSARHVFIIANDLSSIQASNHRLQWSFIWLHASSELREVLFPSQVVVSSIYCSYLNHRPCYRL